MANQTKISGYQVITFNNKVVMPDGATVARDEAPEFATCSRIEAMQRVVAYVSANPDAPEPEMVPQYRDATPVESGVSELANQLQALCNRHGINLGMSRDAIERKLTEELAQYGAR